MKLKFDSYDEEKSYFEIRRNSVPKWLWKMGTNSTIINQAIHYFISKPDETIDGLLRNIIQFQNEQIESQFNMMVEKEMTRTSGIIFPPTK